MDVDFASSFDEIFTLLEEFLLVLLVVALAEDSRALAGRKIDLMWC